MLIAVLQQLSHELILACIVQYNHFEYRSVIKKYFIVTLKRFGKEKNYNWIASLVCFFYLSESVRAICSHMRDASVKQFLPE